MLRTHHMHPSLPQSQINNKHRILLLRLAKLVIYCQRVYCIRIIYPELVQVGPVPRDKLLIIHCGSMSFPIHSKQHHRTEWWQCSLLTYRNGSETLWWLWRLPTDFNIHWIASNIFGLQWGKHWETTPSRGSRRGLIVIICSNSRLVE